MAKPRVFVSSTYYDLKYIRASLEGFIKSFGFEPVLFESGDIPFQHDCQLDESCYNEIQSCHMLVLLIGGRYGSTTSDSTTDTNEDSTSITEQFDSITKKEFKTASARGVPIFIFVDKNVYGEYETFKENRDNESIKYTHVDDVNIYRFIDEILTQHTNYFVRGFEGFDDISTWLRDQWAGLFADFLSRQKTETDIKDLASQVQKLGDVSDVLKEYTESILRKIQPEKSQSIIETQSQRLYEVDIQRFVNEPLIEFLCLHRPQITPATLFNAMESAPSVEQFLEASQFSKSEIEDLISKYELKVRADYKDIRQKYLKNVHGSEH